ncbi:putative capsular polysaccharide synthesis family protein [Coleofasciculus sp. G3-WIS-01]|uniref:putative capsular polysaccharide synthesis family protein n=1 Tax=Coleofasciculus sp. G3-WIS-01 TaxID=3069528 RepID=UPI0040637942
MGKVASSSICQSLKSANITQPLYQVHTLNREWIQKKWRTIKLYKAYNNRPVIDQDFLISTYISDHLDQILNRKLKIISIVRDPLQRNISDFFQNIEQYFPNFAQRFSSGQLRIDDIIETFWDNQGAWGVDYAKRWFNRELKAVLGIDVMAVQFPKDKGYVVIQHPDKNIEILLVKFESFNQCLERSLCDFFGLKQIQIKLANVSQKKDYYQAYKEFQGLIRFPKDYLDNIYRNPLMYQFYTEAEINQFQHRWE